MTETTAIYPVSISPSGRHHDTIVIHGAGTGDGPDDVLSDDRSVWDIAIVVPALMENDGAYAAGLARIGFEPAGREVNSHGVRTGQWLDLIGSKPAGWTGRWLARRVAANDDSESWSV